MTAFNVVRFRVKPGREQEFIDAHKMADPDFKGMRRFSMIDTGDGTFCIVGEWESFDDIVAARPSMVEMLDTVRDMLEELDGDLGVTDPISGKSVLEMGSAPATKRRASTGRKKAKAAKRGKPAAKKAAKKPAKKAKAAKRGRKR